MSGFQRGFTVVAYKGNEILKASFINARSKREAVKEFIKNDKDKQLNGTSVECYER